MHLNLARLCLISIFMEVEYFSHNGNVYIIVGRQSTVQLNAVYPLILLHELYKLIRNQL